MYLSLVLGSVVEAAGSVQWATLLVIVVAGTVAVVVTCRWAIDAERDAALAPGDVVER